MPAARLTVRAAHRGERARFATAHTGPRPGKLKRRSEPERGVAAGAVIGGIAGGGRGAAIGAGVGGGLGAAAGYNWGAIKDKLGIATKNSVVQVSEQQDGAQHG